MQSSTETDITETDIEASNDGLGLHGTLCLPEGLPVRGAVLLIGGSGQVDRNENATTIQLNILNAVANCLAACGYASLRFDKRGCGESEGDFDASGHHHFVDDAFAWAVVLASRPELPDDTPMILLGHSEGTLVAAQVATRWQAAPERRSLIGQILITPMLEDFESAIRRQAEQTLAEIRTLPGVKGVLVRTYLLLAGNQLKKQQRLLEKVRRSSKPVLKIRKTTVNALWIRERLALDPVAVHRQTPLPSLIIGAAKDLQCLPTDVERLADELRSLDVDVATTVLDDLTHILRPDRGIPSLQHYRALSEQPVDQRLLDLVVEWLQQRVVG